MLIADDHLLFNEGLNGMLAGEPDLLVVGQVYTGADVVKAVRNLSPDLLLLDVNFPAADGFDLAVQARQTAPSLKLVFLTMYSDAVLVEKAKALGADGYLLKTATKAELLDCVRHVRAGGTCFLSLPSHKSNGEDYAVKYKLTRREVEVIGLIKQGLSSQQIADAVHLSVYTVETHRRNINLKLGVKNPAELIKKAGEMGL